MSPLGELTRVNLRTVWEHEEAEFTPWLLENIGLLGKTLGLELDLVEREVSSGDFFADLVAKDLNSNRLVLIENQLEPTDHHHLGEIMTYAGNRKAGVIVWISPTFRDEHRQALEWLNDVTDEDVDFFGIQLDLYKIGTSLPAPLFSIVAKPSNWKKERQRRLREYSPLREAYHVFFGELLKALKAKSPRSTSAQNVGYNNWFSIAGGRFGFSYSFSFTQTRRFRVELYIDVGDQAANKKAFDLLKDDESALTSQLGEPLAWERLDAKRASRVGLYCAKSIQATDSADDLIELRRWAVEAFLKLRSALDSRVRALRLDEDVIATL
jgi:hypothetical protein